MCVVKWLISGMFTIIQQKLSDANASIEELKANHEAQMNQLKQALDEAHQKHDKLLQEKDGLEKQLVSLTMCLIDDVMGIP